MWAGISGAERGNVTSHGDDVGCDFAQSKRLSVSLYRRRRVTYRRERSTREVYEERFLPDRAMPYPRATGATERRAPFSRPEEDYSRGGYEYEGAPRYFPNGGGPRSYHAEEQRGYHGESVHFSAERRPGPPARREEYPYRVPREDPHPARTVEFGEDREAYRRKAVPFPPIRERSPIRRTDVPPRSPHSRSGSSVSSRSYSPDRAKALPFTPQQGKGKLVRPPMMQWGVFYKTNPNRSSTIENKCTCRNCVRTTAGSASAMIYAFDCCGFGLPNQRLDEKLCSKTRFSVRHGLRAGIAVDRLKTYRRFPDGNFEDVHPVEAEREEPVVAPIPPVEESHKTAADDFQERRAHAIAAKARDIEKVYRQDCETFGMVVKMLVAKDPNLEKQLQVPLRENLGEIRERCLEDLKHFISELDEAGRQSETLA
ncbi:unnamed protein product [Merluccius merluccius]